MFLGRLGPGAHAVCDLVMTPVFIALFANTGKIVIIFTARRLVKRGICRRRVSVRLCVCVCVRHTPVLYQNG